MSSNFYIDGVLVETMYGAKGASTAAATGIKVNNVDLNQLVLALVDGQTGPTSGVESNSSDLKTFFGIPLTSLPINGQKFTGAGNSGTGSSSGTVYFSINTSGWEVVTEGTNQSTVTQASGSVPSGAVSIEITDTWQNASGDTSAGTVTNTASTKTTIPSSGGVGDTVSVSATPGSDHQTTHTVQIVLYDSGGSAISTTTCTFVAVATGAA